MAIYGDGTLYGSGSFYGPSGTDAPQNLSFYRTNQDGVYVFWWTFLPSFISPALSTLNFELQLDTDSTFTSPNLVDFISALANDTTQSITFNVTAVVDSTHLIVDSTTGMMNGDTIVQGSNSTTITTVTDSTHLVVGSTVGWVATNVITFQNGNVAKGFAVPVAARIEGVVQVWYARARTVDGISTSAWSVTLTWTIPQKTQQFYAESLMEALPDAHVYGKGDLLKPVSQRNSNLYLIENMYGNQLDLVYYTNFLTRTDNFLSLCRDENLYNIYGVLFNFLKPLNMTFVEYRFALQNLTLASLMGSTVEAIQEVVRSFTGVDATLIYVRDENDFFLSTVQDPAPAPGGPTVFTTAYPYIPGTLRVEQLTGTLAVTSTTGFVPGIAEDTTTNESFTIISILSPTQLKIIFGPHINSLDTITQGLATTTVTAPPTGGLVPSVAYTEDPAHGRWIMSVATTDTLQATYDIGNPGNPFPVVFDALFNATALTGTVTFTNGSTAVTGSGTLFSTEVVHTPPPPQITDSVGVYLGTVASVTDNTHLVLTQPWAGPTETGVAYNLFYTDNQLPPPILWEAQTLAWGVIIQVNNPGEFVLNHSLIEALVNLILPAHIKAYYVFP